MSKTLPVHFRIKSISTNQFAILDKSKLNQNLKIELKVLLNIDVEEKIISVNLSFNFTYRSKKIMILEVSNDFEIKKEDWPKLMKDSVIHIDKNLALHLAMITVGTARGILHCRTSMMDLQPYVLPSINLFEIIKEDVEIPLNI